MPTMKMECGGWLAVPDDETWRQIIRHTLWVCCQAAGPGV
jgi:hypothetical protein